MIIEISDCCDCGLPCRREACPHYRVSVHKCDECGDYECELYKLNGEELCIECIKERLEVVK